MDEKDLEKYKDVIYGQDTDSSSPKFVNEAKEAYQVERIYTYEDYLAWPEDERIELIDGKIYYMSAPTKKHQDLLLRLGRSFGNYLHGKSCDVYIAPFDVRIDLEIGKDSVVQPDLVVICDNEKLDEKGLNGAPDLVIEVLSRSTASKDRTIKYNKYLAVGVKEYWLVDPNKEEVIVNILNKGIYEAKFYSRGDVIKPTVLTDLYINVEDLLDGYKGNEIAEIEEARKEEQIKAETKIEAIRKEERMKFEAQQLDTAKRLIKSGMSIEQVAQITGLDFERIQNLR